MFNEARKLQGLVRILLLLSLGPIKGLTDLLTCVLGDTVCTGSLQVITR
jgi:hypothetical protein